MSDRHKGFLLPTELRTKELAALPVWIRERSFFMAAVDRVETLQEFSSRVDRIVRGDLTVQEARQELSGALDALGYQPEAGQEGTIKDLRTVRRKDVALRTNVAQVHGYSLWAHQQRALDVFPAQRFVRQRIAREPRMNWPERFAAAVAATTPEGANVEALAALVNHPCWVALSVFGTPYAPFDFGSGMGLEPMMRDEAEALGIVPAEGADPEHAAMMEPQDRGLNEALEAKPAVNEGRFRMAISQALQGLAEWEGKTLKFTDPNGTRPYTAEKLAEVIDAVLPAGIPKLQAEAVKTWAEDPAYFRRFPGSDKAEDLARLVRRTEPLPEGTVLYRGEGFATEEQARERLAGLAREGAMHPLASSFTRDAGIAEFHAGLRWPGVQVRYRVVSKGGARSISPSVARVAPDFAAEEEVLYTGRTKMRAASTVRRVTPQGVIYEVELEERP